MTATTPASYANVLHRLSLGEEVPGAELLALPQYDSGSDVIVEPIEYSIDMLPGLLKQAAKLSESSYTTGPNCDPVGAVNVVIDELLTKHHSPHTPVPGVVRDLLWQIGIDADLAVRLKGLT